jgi:hypothetical protein
LDISPSDFHRKKYVNPSFITNTSILKSFVNKKQSPKGAVLVALKDDISI